MATRPVPSPPPAGRPGRPALEPGNRSAGRVLTVLDAFVGAGTDLGVSEIAHDVGLGISTTHRLLRTLVAAGYVVQDRRTERYRLGPAVMTLAQAHFASSGLELVRAALERLSDEVGESVTFCALEGQESVQHLQANSTKQALRFETPNGSRAPVHVSAIGKALLAQGEPTPELIASLGPLMRATPGSITDPELLLADLRRTHERGWALLDEEREPGVRAVAVAVVPRSGAESRVGVSVQGPVMRFPDERLPELATALQRAAAELAAVLPPDWP
ncbi:IclR family transcriptional regulator [Patulibacter sp. NPDC049589]|uniref:IclR family transcriptional regulator n=1 Tax=Patulibacter sp. NPDC049589 TaxID=3154731 RepID=UPI003411FB11